MKPSTRTRLIEVAFLLGAGIAVAVTRIWLWSAFSAVVQKWLLGAGLISGLGGAVSTYILWKRLHSYGDDKGWDGKGDIIAPFPIAIGVLERIFFTVLIAFDVSGTGGGLMGWLALKLAVGWQRLSTGKGARARAAVALIVGMLSLLFAVVGGVICRGRR